MHPRRFVLPADESADAPLSNPEIAARLDEVADLLRQQDADAFRVRAYRRAAARVRTLREPVRYLFEREGVAGLERLPTVGPVIARAIRSLVLTGHLPMLDRMRGEIHPASALASVSGIGRILAQRIEEELGVRTLAELELAAHDGRLARIPGFGEKRVRGIREALATRLRQGRAAEPRDVTAEPSVAELLDVDSEYRRKGAAGTLYRIAPRRFNPTGEAWLPILHTTRGNRHYTALFSNTAQAHRLEKTHDWVVLYCDEGAGERQYTVVTATHGPLSGRRVVRGREAEAEWAEDRRSPSGTVSAATRRRRATARNAARSTAAVS